MQSLAERQTAVPLFLQGKISVIVLFKICQLWLGRRTLQGIVAKLPAVICLRPDPFFSADDHVRLRWGGKFTVTAAGFNVFAKQHKKRLQIMIGVFIIHGFQHDFYSFFAAF